MVERRTVDLHTSFQGWSYIYSLLTRFITLIRAPGSRKDASSLLWSIWDDSGIPMLCHVEVSQFFWLVSKCLSPIFLDLSSAVLFNRFDTWHKSVSAIEIHWFWFLVTKPSGTSKFAHLTVLWDGLWHALLLMLQALYPHEMERLERNCGMGILAVTMAFWELLHWV